MDEKAVLELLERIAKSLDDICVTLHQIAQYLHS